MGETGQVRPQAAPGFARLSVADCPDVRGAQSQDAAPCGHVAYFWGSQPSAG